MINFYADLLYPPGLRAFVYGLGERDSVRATTLIFQQEQQFSMQGSREGPWKPFVLRDLRSTAFNLVRPNTKLNAAMPGSFVRDAQARRRGAGDSLRPANCS